MAEHDRTFLEDFARDFTTLAALLADYAERDAIAREAQAEGAPTARTIAFALEVRRARAAAFGLDLTHPGWTFLLELWRAHLAGEHGVRLCHLAPAAQIAHTTADRWLARLEQAGLVERAPDPDPATASGVHARLTPRAATAMATHHKAAAMARLAG